MHALPPCPVAPLCLHHHAHPRRARSFESYSTFSHPHLHAYDPLHALLILPLRRCRAQRSMPRALLRSPAAYRSSLISRCLVTAPRASSPLRACCVRILHAHTSRLRCFHQRVYRQAHIFLHPHTLSTSSPSHIRAFVLFILPHLRRHATSSCLGAIVQSSTFSPSLSRAFSPPRLCCNATSS